MTAPVTEASFRALCQAHDITHAYSDDARVRREGWAQLEAIRTAAKALPPGVAKRIWDETVRAYFIHEHDAAEFLWVEVPA